MHLRVQLTFDNNSPVILILAAINNAASDTGAAKVNSGVGLHLRKFTRFASGFSANFKCHAVVCIFGFDEAKSGALFFGREGEGSAGRLTGVEQIISDFSHFAARDSLLPHRPHSF